MHYQVDDEAQTFSCNNDYVVTQKQAGNWNIFMTVMT